MKYVCVLSTDNYLEGILVLNENLKHLNSKYELLCLVNQKISEETKQILDYFNIEYKIVEAVEYNKECWWKNTFDKLNIFSLIEYDKLVYLDSDLYIRDNIDHLFQIDKFTMTNDRPFSDLYNSGVMVIKPSIDDFLGLKNYAYKAALNNRNDIGDQTIIEEYFKDINKLDESYNEMRQIMEESDIIYDSISKTFQEKYRVKTNTAVLDNPKIIHYILTPKPWMTDKPYNDEYYDEYNILLSKVRSKLQEFYLSKKKLLVISYVNQLDQNIKDSLLSLINQKYNNMTAIIVVEGNNEVRDYINSFHKDNITCVDNLSYDKLYDDYDYVTFFSPQILLKDACYEDCIRTMISRDLDCVQFGRLVVFLLIIDGYAPNVCYYQINNKDDIKVGDKITENIYDKIYKVEKVKNCANIDEFLNSVSNIGLIGKPYYKTFD